MVSNISSTTGLSKDMVEVVVDKFINEIKKAAINKEDILIRGLGSFKVVTRKAKIGRNISKGTKVHIPEKLILKLKPSKDLINKMNR